MVRLSEREQRALKVLAERYGDEDGSCLYMRTIAGLAGIDRKMIRRIVRSLARKGMAELVRGLWSDEGLAGSGYCCTWAGKTYCELIEAGRGNTMATSMQQVSSNADKS